MPEAANWRVGELCWTKEYLVTFPQGSFDGKPYAVSRYFADDDAAKRVGAILKGSPAVYLGECGRIGVGRSRRAIHMFLLPRGAFLCDFLYFRQESAPESDEEV